MSLSYVHMRQEIGRVKCCWMYCSIGLWLLFLGYILTTFLISKEPIYTVHVTFIKCPMHCTVGMQWMNHGMLDYAVVGVMLDYAVVGVMLDYAVVGAMLDYAVVGVMLDYAVGGVILDYAVVGVMLDCAVVGVGTTIPENWLTVNICLYFPCPNMSHCY